MSLDLEEFYRLLPAIYRIRDQEQGSPLKALLAIALEQTNALEEDLQQLYDDQFIETCAEWVVPYIADLIGYRPLYGVSTNISSPRAEVANTIAYRRRKGTALMLEQLAQDVTDWPARVVEFFQVLATTQNLNHLRLENLSFASLRQVEVLTQGSGPFTQLAHSVDVRQIASKPTRQRGRYNIPNIGIFLWRLQAYPVTRGTAKELAAGCYTFSPLGMDLPLFNLPATRSAIAQLAQPTDVPEPLNRRTLYTDLETQRQALADGKPMSEVSRQSRYFGTRAVFELWQTTAGVQTQIPSSQILICDLSDPPAPTSDFWRRPPTSKPYRLSVPPADPTQPNTRSLPIQVAVDPVLGRLAFPVSGSPEQHPDRVEVSYAYGFSADMGGGEYARENRLPAALDPYAQEILLPDDQVVKQGELTLSQALTNLSNQGGRIALSESRTHEGSLNLAPAPNTTLILRAQASRPVVDGAIAITSAANATVILEGLLLTQGITISGTAPMTLVLWHCTLAPWLTRQNHRPVLPATPAVVWNVSSSTSESTGTLILDHTITGRLMIGDGLRVQIFDSIMDALQSDQTALAASENGDEPTGQITIIRSTVIGRVHSREIDLIEDSLFTGQVTSDRHQHGCLRFSYLPPGSETPPQYRCQPTLASQQAIAAAKLQNPLLTPTQEQEIVADVQSRLEPIFTDQEYSSPGYLQLHTNCPIEITTGAHDGSEMGAFHDLYQAQRQSNLEVRLAEYLRLGLEAGLFYVT